MCYYVLLCVTICYYVLLGVTLGETLVVFRYYYVLLGVTLVLPHGPGHLLVVHLLAPVRLHAAPSACELRRGSHLEQPRMSYFGQFLIIRSALRLYKAG